MLMNSKGQITIPAEIRDELGWVAGDEFEVNLENGNVYLVPHESGLSRGERLVQRMRGTADTYTDLTTDELMAMLRDD